jgi:hypothetical protein
MNHQQRIDYWAQSAAHDLEVAETLFQGGKHDWCLYIAHLVLEKILKALYVKHIAARYPDEKMKFYKMCTRAFTADQFNRIKEIYQWLLQKTTR